MRHLITGAGSGIGAALARILDARGDSLVLLVRSADRAEQIAAQFPRAEYLIADLEQPGSLHGVGRDLTGGLDSLVHSAGVVDLSLVAEQRLDAWQRQLDVNLTSPAVLTRELLPHLRSNAGSAIFINSGAGLNAHPHWSAYAASKFGLRGFADALRLEEAGHGVRVTTIYPGRTDSPMQQRVHEQEGAEYTGADWIRPDTVAEAIRHVIDLPRDAALPELMLRPGPR